MDRRPWHPRQLAGEYGSSEHSEVNFDVGRRAGERRVDAGTDAVRPVVALDDVVDAGRVDVAFKPKCLGIDTSSHMQPNRPIVLPRSNRSTYLRPNQTALLGFPTTFRLISANVPNAIELAMGPETGHTGIIEKLSATAPLYALIMLLGGAVFAMGLVYLSIQLLVG